MKAKPKVRRVRQWVALKEDGTIVRASNHSTRLITIAVLRSLTWLSEPELWDSGYRVVRVVVEIPAERKRK